MKWNEAKSHLLSNPKLKKAYRNPSLSDIISDMLIEARARKGMTQKELADKLTTKQSSIARLENGNTLPSLSFLKRIAEAYGTELIAPKFSFMADYGWETDQIENKNHSGGVHASIIFSEDIGRDGYFSTAFSSTTAEIKIPTKDLIYT